MLQLRLWLASLNFNTELVLLPASHMSTTGSDLQRHLDGAQSASPQARGALANPHL